MAVSHGCLPARLPHALDPTSLLRCSSRWSLTWLRSGKTMGISPPENDLTMVGEIHIELVVYRKHVGLRLGLFDSLWNREKRKNDSSVHGFMDGFRHKYLWTSCVSILECFQVRFLQYYLSQLANWPKLIKIGYVEERLANNGPKK